MSTPPVVSEQEWAAANAQQVDREKAHMKAADALWAQRRELPMVEIDPSFRFEAPGGPMSFAELFDGRPQLIVYNFMLKPHEPDFICPGCSMFTDNLPDLSHVRARDTTFVLASRVPLDHIARVRETMGWTVPWVSSEDRFNEAVGALVDGQDTFRYTVFLRDGDRIFKTYATAARGVEILSSVWGLLDSTPYGRQEEWQDAPAGWPQGPAYAWWRRHTEYDSATKG